MKELSVLFFLAAIVAAVVVCDKRYSERKYLHGLPYIFGAFAVIFLFQLRPDSGWESLVVFPMVGGLHFLAFLNEHFK